MKTELKERLSRLVEEGDEQRLARIQTFIHREEGGVGDDAHRNDEDLETLQGYTKEENEKFLDECEQIYKDVVSGKDLGYTLEEAKDIIYRRKPVE